MPAFGFGIRPRGPRTRPSWPSWPMTSGVATMTSHSSQPSLSFWMYSMPTKSAPAASASRTRSPWVITNTRTGLPVPWGSTTVPRTTWSAWRGIDAEPHGDVHRLVELGERRLLHQLRRPPGSGTRAPGRPWRPRPELLALAWPSVHHLQAHRPGGAGDHPHGADRGRTR